MYKVNQIKKALADRNLKHVARETGLHYETVRRIAQGISTNPDHKTTVALSDYLEQRDEEVRGAG